MVDKVFQSKCILVFFSFVCILCRWVEQIWFFLIILTPWFYTLFSFLHWWLGLLAASSFFKHLAPNTIWNKCFTSNATCGWGRVSERCSLLRKYTSRRYNSKDSHCRWWVCVMSSAVYILKAKQPQYSRYTVTVYNVCKYIMNHEVGLADWIIIIICLCGLWHFFAPTNVSKTLFLLQGYAKKNRVPQSWYIMYNISYHS